MVDLRGVAPRCTSLRTTAPTCRTSPLDRRRDGTAFPRAGGLDSRCSSVRRAPPLPREPWGVCLSVSELPAVPHDTAWSGRGESNPRTLVGNQGPEPVRTPALPTAVSRRKWHRCEDSNPVDVRFGGGPVTMTSPIWRAFAPSHRLAPVAQAFGSAPYGNRTRQQVIDNHPASPAASQGIGRLTRPDRSTSWPPQPESNWREQV